MHFEEVMVKCPGTRGCTPPSSPRTLVALQSVTQRTLEGHRASEPIDPVMAAKAHSVDFLSSPSTLRSFDSHLFPPPDHFFWN
eukprot:m.15742 g.15742  ORF g.15742 m.15742 type:complete len:83 (+) comp26406_c0_seq1:832-1080(+)